MSDDLLFFRDDPDTFNLEPGAAGWLVVRRPRKGLRWLRFIGLDRWAYSTEVHPATVTS